MSIWSDDDDMTTQDLTPRESARELKRLATAVDKVTKYLFGNGEKGMDEILRKTDETLDKLVKSFDDYKNEQISKEKSIQKQRDDNQTWIKRTIIITAIPYILSFIVWIIYWYFKLQPLLQELEKQVK